MPTPAVNLKSLLADPAGAGGSRDRMAAMQESLKAAKSALEQANVELAVANWLLAVPTGSPATRWILGLSESNDAPRIRDSATEAQTHLARARKLLAAVTDDDKDRREELRSAASTLEAFAKLLAACAQPPASAHYKDSCEDAAVGMAGARESEKPQLAAAAMLWQSFAWVSAGRQERAFTTLPDALSKPERLPYDFLAKLLRCRLLGDTGQPAAAIALLMRIQGSGEDWFPQQDKAALDARRRLAAVVQWKVTQDWLRNLRPRSSAAADQVAATLPAIRDVLMPNGKPGPVYHMETAIPILVEAPAVREPSGDHPAAPGSLRPASSRSNSASEPASSE